MRSPWLAIAFKKGCAVNGASAKPSVNRPPPAGEPSAEVVLGERISRANRALSAVTPVLGHMLASSGHSLVSDAILARLRGMLTDLAHQLVRRIDAPILEGDAIAIDPVQALAGQLAHDAPLLAHLHCNAMEGLLTGKLEKRSGIDPVLSPLWQELIASANPATAEAAMQALAAQSRFLQAQRRMQYPVFELPADALERVLRIWARSIPLDHGPAVTGAMRELKSDYDEAGTRIGQITRLASTMHAGLIAALDVEHAGFALFVSALARLSDQPRDRAVLACHEHQSARLALSLRATGQDAGAIERQALMFGSAEHLPHRLEQISSERARALLADADRAAFVQGAG